MRIAETFGMFIYGHGCLGCGKSGMQLDPWLCTGCGEALEELGTKPFFLDSENVLCLYPMTELTHKLVLALKYGGMRDLGGYLVERSSARGGEAGMVLEAWGPDLSYHPVPIHPARLRERGYNQCERIAAALGHLTGGTCERTALYRNAYRESQTWFGRTERGRNVAGAFSVRDSGTVRNRKCVVVDDVYTTGATTGVCSRALQKAGAAAVHTCALIFEKNAPARQDWIADQKMGYGTK